MKTQIHELRTRIDGLAQLVKSLDKSALLIINPSHPELSRDELMEELKKPGHIHYLPAESKIEQIGPGLSFLAESYKSLLLAKAWLGKVLAELGEETPYKNDGNRKTVEDIEPTADQPNEATFPLFDTIKDGIRDMNYIEKIDWLRKEIEKLNEILLSFHMGMQARIIQGEYPLVRAHIRSSEYLIEARFHLGFELSRIKEQSK